MADEVIEELWEVKDAIAKEHGYDVKALVAHLRAKKHEADTQVLDRRAISKVAGQVIQPDPSQPELM